MTEISGYVSGVAAIAMCKLHMTDDDRGPGVNACRNCQRLAWAALEAALPLDRPAVWAEGYSTCLGDFDIAARAEARSPNPYKEGIAK